MLICLIVLLALAIAGLVHYLPAHKTAAVATQDKTTGAPSATATQPSPGNSASSSGPAAASSSPPAGASAAATNSATNSIAAPGGAAGAPLADLSALNPVQQSNVSSLSTGPQQIGSTTYEDSVRFTCDSGSGYTSDIVYDVAGYKYLTALIGIPSNASNAAGNAMTITFYKDSSATQLMTPVTVSLDHPQSVHLNLQGASQLEVACSAISTTSQEPEYMDVAFGNATIGPS